MAQIIRLFDPGQDAGKDAVKAAQNAADELKASGFAPRVATVPPDKDRSPEVADDAITAAGFSRTEAERLAPALGSGGAVLCVEAPFGRGTLAQQIIDRHGVSRPAPALSAADNRSKGAPSRSVLRGKSDHVAAPLSSLLSLPVLLESKPITVGSLGDQRPTFPVSLLRSDLFLSRLLGLPLLMAPKTWARLIHDPAPLSTWLGLPVLIGNRRKSEGQPAVSMGESKP